MEFLQRRSVLIAIAFIVGFSIGLFIFGWWLTPVQYSGAGPQDLLPDYQEIYIQMSADLYSHDLNQDRVRAAFAIWPEADLTICSMAQSAATEGDQGSADRLTTIALILNGQGCTPDMQAPAEESSSSNSLAILLVLLLLALLGGAIYYFMRMRNSGGDDSDGVEEQAGYTEAPEQAPAAMVETGAEEYETTPIARFDTYYARGNDTYDDSFSIENAQGEFLGECGVGISETIGVDTPKNVTAFEVWLFDKNDIRTVTKVLMSEHAYNDEAIRAKLAPKGEPVLARMNETIVLETATLIINAEITEMTYGAGSMPAQSFFEHFAVGLSAWAKSGETDDSGTQGQIDQMLDY